MCQELQIFAAVYMYWGCRLSVVTLCGSDCGITPVDDITIGINCVSFCFHMAHILLLLLLVVVVVYKLHSPRMIHESKPLW